MQTPVILAALVFTLLSGSVSLLLFSLYRPKKGILEDETQQPSRLAPFAVAPRQIGSPYRILILVSVLGLFLELLGARWGCWPPRAPRSVLFSLSCR